MSTGTWREVSRDAPCPICGKPDWCGASDDGASRCMRVADTPVGWRKVKTCPDGGTVFRRADERPAGSSVKRAPATGARVGPLLSFPSLAEAIAAAGRRVGGKHAGTWTYRRGDGREVLSVARFNLAGGRKAFRPFHRDGARYVIGDPPEEDGMLPIYRLPELLGQGRVFVVEGEKCADAAASIGLAATTSAHGAKGASKTDWHPLADRDVVILPDADDVGRSYAEAVAGIMHRLRPPASVRIVELPGLPAGGDICEFIADRRSDGKDDAAIRREILDLADRAAELEPPADGRGGVGGLRPVVVLLSDVQPEPLRWLWPGRIALGKVTMIAGDPGLGKSFITLDMAARVSKGTSWPDAVGEPNPAGGVVLLSAEDDIADTIRPRLDAAGADVTRVVALRAVQQGEGHARTFNLATDLEALESAILGCAGCRLVVVDPITAYLGKIDSHKNAEVRGVLAPLAELAARHGVAIVCVTHLNKSCGGPAIYRTMGSLGFTAASRATWAVTRDKLDPARRLVLPVKNNLAPDKGGLAYTLRADGKDVPPHVEWEAAPVMMSADDALGDGGDDDVPSERAAAADWLREALSAGPMAAKDLKREARQNSISERTLKRAKREAGVEAHRSGFGRGAAWYWALPGTWEAEGLPRSGPGGPVGGQGANVAPNGEPGPLRAEGAVSTG